MNDDRKMNDRNTSLGIIKEMLTTMQQKAVEIFLSCIFMSLLYKKSMRKILVIGGKLICHAGGILLRSSTVPA
jgi:hypothetical protein